MIDFLKSWIEQIAIAIVIVSIIELILPSGNIKKYIKVILGIYVVFCIINPFINNINLFNIDNLEMDKYVQSTSTVNQESMNKRIQDLYIEELRKTIEKNLQDLGYKLNKCEIKANLDTTVANPGIHKIILNVSKSNIEKVEIGTNKDKVQENEEELEKIKESISSKYEISKDLIDIKLK